MGKIKNKRTKLLTEMLEKEGGSITSINEQTPGVQEKLLAMGILPGREIRLLKKFPSYIFQIGHAQFAVDKEVASAIRIIC